MFFINGKRKLSISNNNTLDINNLQLNISVILKTELENGLINSEGVEISFDEENWSTEIAFQDKQPYEEIEFWIKPSDSGIGKVWTTNAS